MNCEQQEIELRAGIELGGTSISIAIGEYQMKGNFLKITEKININTEEPNQTLGSIIKWLSARKFKRLGIASFGPVCLVKNDPYFGYITSTPKYGWKNTSVGPRIANALQIQNYGFDTDVNACAKAEFILGQHNVKQSLAYITIGTGVGVGLIINGQCVHGLVHPEGGHIRVNKLDYDKEFNGVCSYHGDCLEGLCTNISISKRLGVDVGQLKDVSDTNPVWSIVGYYIANLCLNILLMNSVEVIILGGGVMNRSILYPIIRNEFKKLLNGYVQHPLLEDLDQYIKSPSLGNDVGLIGAMLLEN